MGVNNDRSGNWKLYRKFFDKNFKKVQLIKE